MGFFDVYTKPEEVLRAEKPKANTNAALRTYALFGGAIGLLVGLFVAFFAGIFGLASMAAGSAVGMLAGLGLGAIIVFPILGAVFAIVFAGISSGLTMFLARLLGGKGTFVQHYYLNAFLLLPGLVLAIVGGILAIVPFLGWLLNLLTGLYGAYLSIVMISVANEFSKLRALATYVLTIVVVVVIAFIVALMVGVALFASMAR